ncbi:oligomeric Golgi complex component, partial [Reticulomyxa filosa]
MQMEWKENVYNCENEEEIRMKLRQYEEIKTNYSSIQSTSTTNIASPISTLTSSSSSSSSSSSTTTTTTAATSSMTSLLTDDVDYANFQKKCALRNELLRMHRGSKVGDEMDMDWLTWNTRLFMAHLSLDGTLTSVDYSTYQSLWNDLCEWSNPSNMSSSELLTCTLHCVSQVEKWTNNILRETCREGLIIEFQDITPPGRDHHQYKPFMNGAIVRELLVPTKIGQKFPIPENYLPHKYID